MLRVDLHMHTNRSSCGLHTLLEMLDASVRRGLEAVAVTDHGKALGGPGVSSVLLRRFPGEYMGMKVWKGIEANVLEDGGADVPEALLPEFDVILLGIHPNIVTGQSSRYYTDLLLRCLERNPCVDILAHPDIRAYPVDFRRIARAAAEAGIAVEFNNANLAYAKTDLESVRQLIDAVRETGCRTVISGDAHTIFEIGDDRHVHDAFARLGVSDMSMLNDTLASAQAFIGERRLRRQAIFG